MRLPPFLARLGRNRDGSAAIEFALLGGFMITLLLGILQIGMAMQNYNALRGIAGDVARYAVVQYQSRNEISENQMEFWARSHATNDPYNLPANGMTISITPAANQRVAGATELTFSIQTQVTSILQLVGMRDFYISYSRPIFLINN